MQYLSIGATGLASRAFHYGNSSVCFCLFITGAYTTAQIERVLRSSRRRIWLVASTLTQATLIWAAGVIYQSCKIDPASPAVYVILSFLSFSSASQLVTVRDFSRSELTSVSTSTYINLLANGQLNKGFNSARDYRLASLLSLAVGSFTGACITQTVDLAIALYTAALTKLISTMLFLLKEPTGWSAERRRWHGQL
jgi:Protein of unknown function (DUF1275)